MTTSLPYLEVDPASGTPPFEQLRLQVLAHVEEGADAALASTTRVRRAAEDLVAVAREAGLDDDALLDAVRGALLAAPPTHRRPAGGPAGDGVQG